MISEIPELDTTSYYQAKLEKLASALVAWQNDPTSNDEANTNPLADASALEDCLRDQGLQILPAGPTDGRWRVLIDGRPAPYVGQTRPAGPVDADMAAEMFLVAALGAEESDREVALTVRPATEEEQVHHAVFGDARLYEHPVEIDATLYAVTAPADGGPSRAVVFSDKDGRVVRARLSVDLFEAFAGSVHDEAAEMSGGDAR